MITKSEVYNCTNWWNLCMDIFSVRWSVKYTNLFIYYIFFTQVSDGKIDVNISNVKARTKSVLKSSHTYLHVYCTCTVLSDMFRIVSIFFLIFVLISLFENVNSSRRSKSYIPMDKNSHAYEYLVIELKALNLYKWLGDNAKVENVNEAAEPACTIYKTECKIKVDGRSRTCCVDVCKNPVGEHFIHDIYCHRRCYPKSLKWYKRN